MVIKEIRILQLLSGGPNIIQLLDVCYEIDEDLYILVLNISTHPSHQIFEHVPCMVPVTYTYDWDTLFRTFTSDDIRLYLQKIFEVKSRPTHHSPNSGHRLRPLTWDRP